MSYEAVFSVFEQEISGENKLDCNNSCDSNIIVDNSVNFTNSYIIMGHPKSEAAAAESVNVCYKEIRRSLESPIIFNDIKSVKDWSKIRADLSLVSSVDAESSKEEDWWSSSISEAVGNSGDNNIINLPPTLNWTLSGGEEPCVSNVNWENYVLGSDPFSNTSTASLLDLGNILLVPSASENSPGNALVSQSIDGLFNVPDNLNVDVPKTISHPRTLLEVQQEISQRTVNDKDKHVNINNVHGQDAFTKLPFVKIPKHCLAKGKILKNIEDYLLTSDRLIVNKNVRVVGTETETQTKQLSHSRKRNLVPPNVLNKCIKINGKQNVLILPMKQAKTIQKESLLKVNHPRSLLKINNMSKNLDVLTENFPKEVGVNSKKNATGNPISVPVPIAVVAISTNKSNDTTEIIIKTEEGENVFKGKTSDIMKATQSNCKINTNEPEISDVREAEQNPDKINDEFDDDLIKLQGDVEEELNGLETRQKVLRLQCPIDSCSYFTTKASCLKIHILQHYGVRPFKCDYPSCNWAFYTKFRLKRHQETHFKKKEFKCLLEGCGKNFSTASNLKFHKTLHNRPSTIVCTVENCNEAFQTRQSLEKHLRSHGVEHAPYVCEQKGCGKKFFSVGTLNAHNRLHQHSEEELKCPYCGKVFQHYCRLTEHMNAHMGIKPFKCDFQDCVWAFSTSSKLRRHQRKHTQVRKHKCKICNKAFNRLEHLKDHHLKHFVKKTYVCHVADCRSVFNNKSTMYAHLKMHRNQEQKNERETFPCHVENCNQVFPNGEELRAHSLTGHSTTGSAAGVISFNSTTQVGLLVGMSDLVQCIPTSIDHQGDLSESSTSNVITQVVFTDSQSKEEEGLNSNKTQLPASLMSAEDGMESARTDHTTVSGLHMASDVVLSAGLLQDELTEADLYMGDEAELLGPAGELQVLLLDPPTRLQHSDFEQSTINLRDLE